MRTPIVTPELGVPTATVSLWHAAPGEAVAAGDRVVELLIPGMVIDVAAPASGTLAAWAARPADRVAPGQILGAVAAGE